jgi:hypothetical protein
MEGGANGAHSSETLIKLSKAATGRKLSKESIAKRTASVLGSKRSNETKLKMSIAQLGKKMPKHVRENINKIVSKPVIQISSDGVVLNEYPSMAEAARSVNRDLSSISACVHGKNKHCAGFV